MCGNLTAVLPPAVTSKLGTGRAFRSDEIEEIGQFAYLYLYDRDGRCRAKKLPGCAWQLFVFDCMGRTVFSQDGEQRRRGEWVFTLRDRFGRDCVTGLCKASFDVLRQGTPDFFMHAVRDEAPVFLTTPSPTGRMTDTATAMRQVPPHSSRVS